MRQIFILEKEELEDLKRGEPLKIMFGDQTITLQADVVIRKPLVSKGNGVQSLAFSEKSITDRIPDYIRTHGPGSVREIADGMGVGRAAVASGVSRLPNLRRTGRGLTTVWGLKSEPNEPAENGRKTRENVTGRILEYLARNGPSSAIKITHALKAKKTSVTSALARMNDDRVKRRGHFRKAVWRVV